MYCINIFIKLSLKIYQHFGRSYIIIKRAHFYGKDQIRSVFTFTLLQRYKEKSIKIRFFSLYADFFAVKRIITTGLNFYYMVNAYLLITRRKKFICYV